MGLNARRRLERFRHDPQPPLQPGTLRTDHQVMFTSLGLRRDGFDGFHNLLHLRATTVPVSAGVYMVLRATAQRPGFLAASTGGRFKRRDPVVAVDVLERQWVDDAEVLYIGRAVNLRSRLQDYRDFGLGRAVGHWGGRFIWQLDDAEDLSVCWRPCTGSATAETARLLAAFTDRYGRPPFANVRGVVRRSQSSATTVSAKG
jgi:hypothetical protein